MDKKYSKSFAERERERERVLGGLPNVKKKN
jgi:hypothetical protein